MNKFKPYIRKRFLIDVPVELHDQLKGMAKKENISLNSLITRTLVKMIVNELYIRDKYPNYY